MLKPHDIAYGPTYEDYVETAKSRAGAERIRQSYKAMHPRDHKEVVHMFQRDAWERLREQHEDFFSKCFKRLLRR